MAIVLGNGISRELRNRGLLLQAISKFDASVPVQGSERVNPLRWTDGVLFQPRPCRPLKVIDREMCGTDEAFVSAGTDCLPYKTQQAFQILDVLKGSPLQLTESDLDRLLVERAEEMESWAFASELLSGAGSASGYSLSSTAHAANGTTFGGAAKSILVALAMLENDLANTLHGVEGMIHMSPGLMLLASSTGDVLDFDDVDMVWRTANGTVVVSDPGYLNAPAPTGQAASTPGTNEWIYASGPVEYQATEASLIAETFTETFDFRHNNFTRWMDRTGIVIFDDCPVSAVLAAYGS